MSQPEPPMKHGKRNRDTCDVNSIGEETAGRSSSATPTTMKHFNSLIRAKHASVSWVGNYTIAHTTKIQIGFLKREAMALTTLLSYYQEDGQGATACPVALVSGSGGLGRKLAFFFCGEGRYRSQEKIDLSIGHRMQSQTMGTLAKFGRADFFLGTIQEALRKGLNKRKDKLVLNVTEDGRLDLSDPEARPLTKDCQLPAFLDEMFACQNDICNLLLRHLKFSARNLRYHLCIPVRQGNTNLFELVIKAEPDLFVEGTHTAVFFLAHSAVESQHLPMVRLVFGYIGDIPSLEGVLQGVMIHGLVNMEPTVGSIDILKFLIARGAPVRGGYPSVQIAIERRSAEMVKLLVDHYPKDNPCDLLAECKRPNSSDSDTIASQRWLEQSGLL